MLLGTISKEGLFLKQNRSKIEFPSDPEVRSLVSYALRKVIARQLSESMKIEGKRLDAKFKSKIKAHELRHG